MIETALPFLGAPPTRDRRTLWLALILAAATVAVYAPTLRHGFVSYDDVQYVTSNPQVRAGLTWHGLKWAATTGYFAYWHPLTWLSLMLDAQLYGMNAGGFHLTNLLMHVAATLLLFSLLQQATGETGRSAFVAALFALHPLHVETVAWVAERKGVLSTLFFMLTLRAYFRYAREPRPSRYLPVALLFVAALMTKPMAVTLPCLLLLLDYWPLGRVSLSDGNLISVPPRLILEKLPLFALAAASSFLTLSVVRQLGVLIPGEAFPLGLRLAYSVVTYVAYIGATLWPVRLAAFYPFPQVLSGWWIIACSLGLFAVSLATIREIRRHPYLAVGWFWYLGTMVPVIGVVQTQGLTMTDRYTYVPLIGLFIMAAWGIPELISRRRRLHAALGSAAVGVTLACGLAARGQVRHWANDRALWTHAIDSGILSHVAHNNLGIPLIDEGRIDEAVYHFTEALRLKPDYAEAHMNMGNALAAAGRLEEATAEYSAALRIAPSYATAHGNFAVTLARLGKTSEAMRQFSEALRIEPDSAGTHYNLAGLFLNLGKTGEAVKQLAIALRLDPGYAEARRLLESLAKQGLRGQAAGPRSEHGAGGPGRRAGLAGASTGDPASAEEMSELGNSLLRRGRPEEAAARFYEALRLRPGYVEARGGLGLALLGQGKAAEGIAQLREAVRVAPDNAAARINLGIALAGRGDADESMLHFTRAVQLAPALADGHFNLALLLAQRGKLDEAISHLEAVVRIDPGHREGREALEGLRRQARAK